MKGQWGHLVFVQLLRPIDGDRPLSRIARLLLCDAAQYMITMQACPMQFSATFLVPRVTENREADERVLLDLAEAAWRGDSSAKVA